MKSFIVAVAGLAGSVAAIGSATVINNCEYDVYVQNTPSSGGGYSNIVNTMSSGGGAYSQVWTALMDNAPGGWSIKLSDTEGEFYGDGIMQYEYNLDSSNNIVYFDISCVNGSPCGPWQNEWALNSSDTSNCPVDQSAFMYPDDTTANQQCNYPDVDITLTLCDVSGDTSAASSAISSAAASTKASSTDAATSTSTSVAAATTVTVASSSPTSSAATTSNVLKENFFEHSSAAAATTLATTTSAAAVSTVATTTSADDHVDVVIVTEYATATAWVEAKEKRDVHHHQHQARHPHLRR